MRSVPSRSNSTIKHLINRIIESGHITRLEHINLTSTLLSEHHLTDEDRTQINRVFDYVQTGRLKLTD